MVKKNELDSLTEHLKDEHYISVHKSIDLSIHSNEIICEQYTLSLARGNRPLPTGSPLNLRNRTWRHKENKLKERAKGR